MLVKTLSPALLAVLFTGCANMSTDPGTGSTRNSLIAVAYGTVENVQQVQMKPDYAAGSIIDGALGLLAASGYSSGSQALGAAAARTLGNDTFQPCVQRRTVWLLQLQLGGLSA